MADGRAALGAGNAARARRTLGQALQLWRGPALGDFAYEEFARAEAERLEELRVAALEERIEADLELGRHEHLVAELQALVARHPLRERLWRQLMLALYRSGRQAEALDYFGEARRTLGDELGLEPGDELRRLQAAILRHDPALAAPAQSDGRRTNLPAALSPLLGREQELAELVGLLHSREARLLTLAGAGGSGKTRLALEVARALVDDFANGVFLVELAPLRDAALVPSAIVTALGIELTAGEPAHEALRRRLQGEELLIVADNAEHLPEAGRLLVELLQAAPDLRLLVTSRAVLHLSGERVYRVAPLRPEAAVELFRARAQAAEPRFAPSDADAAVLREICDRLDCLPLAIELAAPRVRTLALDALRERLAPRLPLLTAGPRDLPARQQTLRATLDWSHELLSSEEQRVFRRLGVFVGGCTVEAADEVAGADLDALDALLEHSLLQRADDGRLLLLETVREYALERLAESGEEREIRRRHLLYLTEVARSANVTIEAKGPMRHDLVIREHTNVRAALDWARDAGAADLGLELAALLENYWMTNSPFEGVRRLRELLERAGDLPGDLRARALRSYASAMLLAGEYDEAVRHLEASLAEFRRLGDERGIGTVFQRLAAEELRRGHAERARPLLEDNLASHRAIGFGKGEAVSLGLLANVAMKEGNDKLALELLEHSVALCETTGFAWWHTRALALISDVLLESAALCESAERMRKALPLLKRMGDRPGAIFALARLAQLAARAGEADQAGRLWGAIEAEEARGPVGRPIGPSQTWEHVRGEYAGVLVAVAGPDFEAGRAEGRRMALGETLDYALSES